MNTLTQLKHKSLQTYKAWQKGSPYFCKAINDYLHITLNGWNHLIGNEGHRMRNPSDTYRRLKLLSIARKVIDQSTTFQGIRQSKNKTYISLESVEMINFPSGQVYRKVIVVIQKDTYGKYSFLSVMDRDTEQKKS